MKKSVENYGTELRIFDNGGKTFDRYTIMPPRYATEYREAAPHTFEAIGASTKPFAPGGCGMYVSAVAGSHLGKRIHWDDLPLDVQRLSRRAFPEYAPE